MMHIRQRLPPPHYHEVYRVATCYTTEIARKVYSYALWAATAVPTYEMLHIYVEISTQS